MTAASLGLSASQYRNALGIIAAVKARRWASKAAVIAVETALTESGMRMIASANVPESQKYPHELLAWTDDGLGHDHASCGMFQQQTGTRWTPAGYGSAMNQTTINTPDGWGPPSVLMDAQKSTALFLNALGRVDWQHMDNWLAAQAVQHSAFSNGANYRTSDPAAQRIVNALWTAPAPDSLDPHQLAQEDDVALLIKDALNGGRTAITNRIHCRLLGPGRLRLMIADLHRVGLDSTVHPVGNIADFGVIVNDGHPDE